MKHTLAGPIGLLFLLAITPSGAGAAELIVQPAQNEIVAAAEANDYFLRKHLYTAKRHRIVKVNVDAILDKLPIEITLFPDEKITAAHVETKSRGDNSLLMWKGVMDDRSNAVDLILRSVDDPNAEDSIRSALLSINISAAKFEHDVSSGANFPYYEDGELSRVKSADDKLRNFVYLGTRTKIIIPESMREYVLLPLEMGGPYHLIYEIDRTKQIKSFTDGGPAELDTETEEKRRARQDYMKSLGEDPRQVILRSKKEQRE